MPKSATFIDGFGMAPNLLRKKHFGGVVGSQYWRFPFDASKVPQIPMSSSSSIELSVKSAQA